MKGGLVNPQIETLYKIAVALGVDIAELFGQPVPDEYAARISKLLEGHDRRVKDLAVRVVEVVMEG